MRKKSHISLSRGVIKGLGEDNSIRHKVTFCIGSIVPDCIPSFLVRRHTMEETFDIFVKHMETFVDKRNKREKIGFRQSIRIGMILHYIADYFTLPHNSHYDGGFKEHCVYEGAQLRCMREYVKDVRGNRLTIGPIEQLKDIGQIVDYVRTKHNEYVLQHKGVMEDCIFSLEACLCVARSLLGMREVAYQTIACS